MTRGERRDELLNRIAALKTEPPSETRDLKIRAAELERDLVGSWQIAEHYKFRTNKLRESLLEYLGLEFGKKLAPEELDRIDADWRNERELEIPACRECGKPVA